MELGPHVDNPDLEHVVASRTRLRIADLLSTRPRTLGELAESTHISVQAVLKHLAKLAEVGLVEALTLIRPKRLGVRKVYTVKKTLVGDYSRGSLMVVNLSEAARGGTIPSKDGYRELERLAEDSIIQKGRIRDQARRLARMIKELDGFESRLKEGIGRLPLTEEEKLVAYVMFTEDTEAEAVKTLRSHYACREPQLAIEEVNRKLRLGD